MNLMSLMESLQQNVMVETGPQEVYFAFFDLIRSFLSILMVNGSCASRSLS